MRAREATNVPSPIRKTHLILARMGQGPLDPVTVRLGARLPGYVLPLRR